MRLLAGTSGFSYPAWKGSFYPKELPAARFLGHYAQRLPAVEINNTFYRMPRKELLEKWAAEVPDTFTFALKAPQLITHRKRLREPGDALSDFFGTAAALGGRLGPALFQLPPNQRKELQRLREFLAQLPAGHRAAFEFRHESWFDEEVYAALRESAAALCVSDTGEEGRPAPVVPTAGWGYLRLRRPDYSDADLDEWARRIATQPWSDAFVFFKHEDAGRGPALAEALLRRTAQA
jgi:uncharacterized protein YecE (DUF72 family)